ncbi:hypothetical protein [Arthrobacter bambusae]|uniref:Uncharacterized protein n=1 Tax=Arthrobacter bambusae TaxID=1338426 RepID=A0AAW8DAC1_9MICC|nr:hypothetical protein [Arthrobacter bambusae]MDP9904763.1 hypothetical protein [Arthrobacter bambusae]MDQ0129579.1 hypothetical protein [Arthrobacter bambusae]MDQ0180808.1 hypothetical protein [Arthrobacter bambusae]
MPATYTLPAAVTSPIEQCAWNLHVMLWKELKEKVTAVREVLRHHGLLYPPEGPEVIVPDQLRWARRAWYSLARFSAEGNQRFLTPFDSKSGEPTGPRMEIPSLFLEAPPAECRRLAHQILSDHARSVRDAKIKRLQNELELLQAA